MRQFGQVLKQHGIKQSMSRKGNCLDNALMEGFFGTLKCETIYIEKPQTIEELEQQIHEYMHYYNHERTPAIDKSSESCQTVSPS